MDLIYSFLTTKLPPLIPEYLKELQVANLADITPFNSLNATNLPLRVAETTFNLDLVYHTALIGPMNKSKVVSTHEIRKMLITFPDMISFEGIQADNLTIFSDILPILEQACLENHFSFIKEILSLVTPLLLKLDRSELSKPNVISFVSSIKSLLPESFLLPALSIKVLVYQIAKNMRENIFLSTLYQSVSDALFSIYKDPECWCHTCPFIIPDLVSLLTMKQTHPTNPIERLMQVKLLTRILLLCAAMYPYGFQNTNWQAFLRKIAKVPVYPPPHDIQIEDTGDVCPSSAAAAISTLIAASSFLSHVSTQYSHGIFDVLTKISCSGPMGQGCVAQALLNAKLYPALEPVFNTVKQSFVSSAQLYLSVFESNFSDLAYRLESQYQLCHTKVSAKTLLTDIPECRQLQRPARIVGLMYSQSKIQEGSLDGLARTLIRLNQDIHSRYDFINNNASLRSYLSTLISYMKSGSPLTNPREAIAFSSAVSSVIEFAYSPWSFKSMVLPVVLTLSFYDFLLLISTEKHNALSGIIKRDRQKIARVLAPHSSTFVPMCNILVSRTKPSLIIAALDLLTEMSFITTFSGVSSSLVTEFLPKLVMTESRVVFNIVLKAAKQMDPIKSFETLVNLQESGRAEEKILWFIAELTQMPLVKRHFLQMNQRSKIIERMIKYIEQKSARQSPRSACLAIEIIRNLASPYVSSFSHTEEVFSAAYDTLESVTLNDLLLNLKKLLNTELPVLVKQYLCDLLRYIASPYVVSEMRRIELRIRDNVSEDFGESLDKTISVIAEYDPDYAKNLTSSSPLRAAPKTELPELGELQSAISQCRIYPGEEDTHFGTSISWKLFNERKLPQQLFFRAFYVEGNPC